MSIPEVIARLENTIMGKEAMLISLKDRSKMSTAEGIAADMMVQMLELNIKELNAIQNDLLSIKS
jgi:hypothetical protein